MEDEFERGLGPEGCDLGGRSGAAGTAYRGDRECLDAYAEILDCFY